MLELCLAGFGQTQSTFPPVIAATFGNPALPLHDLEGSGESRAVDCEDFAQLALRDFSGQRKRLQDGELGGPQPQWAQCVFIYLGERPRSAAETAAHAGQFRYR